MKRKRRLLILSTALLLAACGTGRTQTETTSSTTTSTKASTTSTTTTATSTTVTETTTVARDTKEATTSKSPNTSTTEEAIAPEKTTEVTTMYHQTITRRQSAGVYQVVFDDIADLDEASENSIWSVPLRVDVSCHTALTYAKFAKQLRYAYYDMNGDGVNEMFVKLGNNLCAIYYFNGETVSLLAEDYIAGGGGGRSSVTVYQDGRVMVNNWDSGSGDGRATVLQLSGQSLYEVDAVEYQALQFDENDLGLANASKLSSDALSWQSF